MNVMKYVTVTNTEQTAKPGPRLTKGYNNNRTIIDINRSSMANRVLRKLAINHNPL